MVTDTPKSSSYIREPLKYSGSLYNLSHFDATTIIGREYPTVQLADIIQAENADDMLRDLAITSTSGLPVDFFLLSCDITYSQRAWSRIFQKPEHLLGAAKVSHPEARSIIRKARVV